MDFWIAILIIWPDASWFLTHFSNEKCTLI